MLTIHLSFTIVTYDTKYIKQYQMIKMVLNDLVKEVKCVIGGRKWERLSSNHALLMLIPAFHLEPGSPWRDQGGFLKEAILRKIILDLLWNYFIKWWKWRKLKAYFNILEKIYLSKNRYKGYNLKDLSLCRLGT